MATKNNTTQKTIIINNTLQHTTTHFKGSRFWTDTTDKQRLQDSGNAIIHFFFKQHTTTHWNALGF